MSSRPSDLATDTRWCPSRMKYRSPILYSETGGSDSPRRWAEAMRSQRLRRRGGRGQWDWASGPGKPLLTRGGASPAGADGVAVQRVVQRPNEREDPVEAGDPEGLHDRVIVADDHERPAPQLEAAMGPDQHAETRGVDERRPREVDDHVRAAGVDR